MGSAGYWVWKKQRRMEKKNGRGSEGAPTGDGGDVYGGGDRERNTDGEKQRRRRSERGSG